MTIKSNQSYQFMPFSVFKDIIDMNNSEKSIMIERILNIKNSNKNDNSAWTSDLNGEQFLLRNKFFRKLYKEIGTKVKEYASTLNINIEMIDFYMQRSWATVCNKNEYLNPHKHWQSNISFAYYLKKPLNSGNIVFSFNENPNEIANKLFSYDKLKKGLLHDINNLNQTVFEIDAMEDEIVIFPSKTAHSTMRNLSNEDRISISGDISIMLKNSNEFEHLLPNPNLWQRF
tara:strand:- start:130 stop:819 length:690 start_codon:yes stop_codon:yes gene_type:complete